MRRGLFGGFFVAVAAAVCIVVSVEAGQPAAARANTYLVQLSGPVLDAWKTAIAAEGGELLEYVPQFAFRVRMSPDVAARVRRLAFVSSVNNLQRGRILAPSLRRNGKRVYIVRLEPGANANDVAGNLRAAGAEVLARGRQLMITADSSQLDRIADIDGLATIENFAPRIKHNEYGGGVIMGSGSVNASGYDGSTQTIGIADTGLGLGTAATAHADLAASRVASIFNWPGTPDFCFETIQDDGAKDVDTGHGTHVATAAVGGGNPAGLGRGTAPAASLVFQALENYTVPSFLCSLIYGLPEGYYLVGIPSDVGSLFNQAYQQGARVHSDSWGAEVQGEYNADAANADAFIWSHRDLAVTFSAGNSGVDADGNGLVDLVSINSPGTAKNVITVGASENDRQSHWDCDPALSYTTCASQGGQNDIFTYGSAWPDRYPANPLHDDPSAGNAQQMAAFSSRGPTADGRIKPDVVAPGTWNLSGYSTAFQQQYDPSPNPVTGEYQYDGWGFPANSSYKYLGGTSMAAPLVAGGAAVVRDFYQKARGHNASAALVKAVLINSAVDLLDENNDGVLDNAYPIPNPHEGWGRVDLVNATDQTDAYYDEAAPLSTGTSAAFAFTVTTPGVPLKATLAWTDYPSSASAVTNLVNDLDLTVTAPDGTTYRGNVFSEGWSTTGGAADRLNNVENVYVFGAAAGTWTLTVSGYNVPQGPQPFALVIDNAGQQVSMLPTVRVTVDDATATEAGPTNGLLRFTRSGDTSASLEVAYTVSGSATAGADYTALSGFVTIPEGAVDATVVVAALDDSLFENPETVNVMVTPTPAYTVGSPASGVVTITSDDLPADLTISAVVVPTWGAPGVPTGITVVTRNEGPGPAAASHTAVYFSVDAVWDAADVMLGAQNVPALASGANDYGSLTVTMPNDTPPGSYYLVAKADADATVTESNETNNLGLGVWRAGADLIVSVSSPATAAAGRPLTVSDTTRNQGGTAAPASQTAFYLSTNETLDAGDTFLGSRSVSPLGYNQTNTASTTLNIPASTGIGTYYVLAQADSGNVVPEYLESNNVRASGGIQVGVDLAVTVLSPQTAGGAGETINVNETTTNIGAADAAESVTRFYLSTNTTLDAGDPLVGSRVVPALAAGASSAVVAQVTIPPSTATGKYYLFANADDTRLLTETIETNNAKMVALTVGPDLSIFSLVKPAAAAPGGTLDIVDSTKNIGRGVTVPSQTSFYLSRDSFLDGTDIFLGVRDVPALAGNAVSAATTTVTVPAGTAPKSYYLIAKADHTSVVSEVSETNNITVTDPFFVGPELWVTAITGPLSALAGATVTMNDTTRNDGSLVGPTTTTYYLSTDYDVSANDIVLGSRTVSPLGTGASETASLTFVVPVGQPAGTYYVLAKADNGNVAAEPDETNNVRAKMFRVQ